MHTARIPGRGQLLVGLVAALSLLVTATAGAAPAERAPASDRAEVIVAFDRHPGSAEEALIERVGGEVSHRYANFDLLAASLPAAAVDGLARNPRVERVEPVVEVFSEQTQAYYDAELAAAWGVEHLGAGIAHIDGDTGSGVRVAVLDSGIASHPDLDVDPACSFGLGYGTWDDGHGHGTHVAGTIGALRNGTGVVGVAPDVTLCAIKVLDDDGRGSSIDVIDALDKILSFNQAADRTGPPIRITNNSYGFGSDPGTAVRDVFAQTNVAGVLHVSSAGNGGNRGGGGSNCSWPAPYDSVIAVAATDRNDTRAAFSSTCAELELSAPGVSITSTYLGDGTESYSGTSMASPHVAGTAALLLGVDSTLTTDELRSVLTSTALPLGALDNYGHGLVQPLAALAAVRGGSEPEPDPVGSITGTVTVATDDGSAGSAIDGAEVTVVDTTLTATTDGDGTYAIADVPAGEQTLEVSADGFVTSTTTVSVVDGGTSTADVVLEQETSEEPDEPSDPVEPEDPFSLTVSTTKERGLTYATLTWNDDVADGYDVYRGGVDLGVADDEIEITGGVASYTDATGERGSPTFDYQVCLAGAEQSLTSPDCSQVVTASW